MSTQVDALEFLKALRKNRKSAPFATEDMNTCLSMGEAGLRMEGDDVNVNTAMYFMLAGQCAQDVPDHALPEDSISVCIALFRCGDFFWKYRNNIKPDLPPGSSHALAVGSAWSFWSIGLEKLEWVPPPFRQRMREKYIPCVEKARKEILAIWVKEFRPGK